MAYDVSQLSAQERKALLWRHGRLEFLYLPHQLSEFKRFEQWQQDRRDPRKQGEWAAAGAQFDNLRVFEWARRVGKSSYWLITLVAECIQHWNRTREPAQCVLATAFQGDVKGIFVPLARKLFNPDTSGCPEGFEPRYVTSHQGESEGFVIPAAGNSFIKLVGLDVRPDGLRGRWCDAAVVSECGFIRAETLNDALISTLMPQFLGRKHGWIALESSTPEEPDHPFLSVYKEDAVLRGAYSKLTIDDNPTISEDDKQQEIRRMGGRYSPRTRREFFCEEVRDETLAIVPEFDLARHVITPQQLAEQFPRPPYALGVTCMDPGFSDMCGLVWFYTDWQHGKVIVEAAWGERNKSTVEIADAIRTTEAELWGSRTARIEPPAERKSLREMLNPVSRIAPAPSDGFWDLGIDGADPASTPAKQVWAAPEGAMCYWDDHLWSLRPNPYRRISDVQKLLQADLRQQHGLSFETAAKGAGSLDAHVKNLRTLFADDRVRIVNNGRTEKLIAALRSGSWKDGSRTAFKSTPTLGHCDVLAAFMYGARAVDLQRNPFKPAVVDPNPGVGFALAPHTRKLVETYSGGLTFGQQTYKSGRAPRKSYR